MKSSERKAYYLNINFVIIQEHSMIDDLVKTIQVYQSMKGCKRDILEKDNVDRVKRGCSTWKMMNRIY